MRQGAEPRIDGGIRIADALGGGHKGFSGVMGRVRRTESELCETA